MSLRFPIALALSICSLTTPVWADFETGMDAHQRGNYATALREWRPLAEEGDAQAQLHLGLLYAKGNGVSQNYTMARQWYEKAATQGYAMAQFHLGLLYANGDGSRRTTR
jgi:TPR repeat protein